MNEKTEEVTANITKLIKNYINHLTETKKCGIYSLKLDLTFNQGGIVDAFIEKQYK